MQYQVFATMSTPRSNEAEEMKLAIDRSIEDEKNRLQYVLTLERVLNDSMNLSEEDGLLDNKEEREGKEMLQSATKKAVHAPSQWFVMKCDSDLDVDQAIARFTAMALDVQAENRKRRPGNRLSLIVQSKDI